MRLTIIVGFPRSGTSLVSHILSDDVFYAGNPDQIRENKDVNPNGIWESNLISGINDNLFKLFKIDWMDPDAINKITAIDWQDPEIRSQVRRYLAQAQLVINSLIRQIKQTEDKTHIYWKDPRTSLLLSFWLQAIRTGNQDGVFDENIDTINIVWCFRNTEEATDSVLNLDKDTKLTKEQFLQAWDLYNSNIAKVVAANKLLFFLVSYNDIIKNPKKVITALFEFLGEEHDKDRINKAVAKVDPDLHQFKSKKKSLPKLYTRLVEICSKQIS